MCFGHIMGPVELFVGGPKVICFCLFCEVKFGYFKVFFFCRRLYCGFRKWKLTSK